MFILAYIRLFFLFQLGPTNVGVHKGHPKSSYATVQRQKQVYACKHFACTRVKLLKVLDIRDGFEASIFKARPRPVIFEAKAKAKATK